MTKIPEILPDPTLQAYVDDIRTQFRGKRVVILCETQLMVRRTRRLFQTDAGFLAPVITTINAWLEEMTLLHLPPEKLPARILPPNELAWFVAEIIARMDDLPPIFSAPEGLKAVTHWITTSAAQGFTLETLAEPFHHEKNEGFPKLLREISRQLRQRRFLPRGFLPTLSTLCAKADLFPDVVISWFLEPGTVARTTALRHWASVARNTRWLQFTHKPLPEGNSVKSLLSSIGHKFRYFEPQTTEHEIERIFREIASEILYQNRLPGDFVILMPDIEAARPHVQRLSAETGIPIYVSKGDTLAALPLIRRFMLLLEFLAGDDKIDHLVQIFGDNLLQINAFSGITTHAPPKVREFGQRSRILNRRTLREIKALPPNVEDHGGLIETLLQHTDAMVQRFRFDKKQRLSQWLKDEFVPVFTAQQNMGGEIAGNLRNALVALATECANTLQLLESDRVVEAQDALAFFRLVVAGATEPNIDKPDAVLLTQPSQFALTHGKTVFLCGMNADSWPEREPTNFLQFSWPEQASQVFPDATVTERWKQALNRFHGICSSAAKVVASCERYGSTGASAPSPLFVEIKQANAAMLQPATLNVRPVDIARHERNFPAPVLSVLQPAGSVRLSAFVKFQRRKLLPGIYDGVFSDHPAALAAVRERLVKREKPFAFSATTTDTYILSPHAFFLKMLLEIDEPREYRELLDPEEKGTLVHAILEAFYSENAKYSPDLPLCNPATDWHAARERLERIRLSVFNEHEYIFANTDSPFYPKLKEDLTRTLDAWLVEERDRKRNGEKFRDYVPAVLHPDITFRMPPELKFEIPLEGAPFPCLVRGSIDRIDIRTGPPYDAIVTDYKTGSVTQFKKSEVLKGMRSQMPIYLWALMSLHQEKSLQINGACYWGIKPGSRFPEATSIMVLEASAKSRPPVSYNELQAIPSLFVDNRLRWIVRSVWDGVFNLPLIVDEYAPLKELSRIDERLQARRKIYEEQQHKLQHANGLLGRFYAPVNLLATAPGTSQPD